MTRSARSSGAARAARWRRVPPVPERDGAGTPAAAPGRSPIEGADAGGPASAATAENGVAPSPGKPGRHREATLYHALAGAGAGDGRTLAQLREAAREAYAHLELPVWRRSGFWTTSLQGLDLDALEPRPRAAPAHPRPPGGARRAVLCPPARGGPPLPAREPRPGAAPADPRPPDGALPVFGVPEVVE